MKPNFRALAFLAASFLIANPLSGFGQAKEQTVPPTPEVQVPDGTIIHAKLRKDLKASKAQVGDTLELEVVADVKDQPANKVLIPKKARLWGKVSSIRTQSIPEGGKSGPALHPIIWASIEAVHAEWRDGLANLKALSVAMLPPPRSSTQLGAPYSVARDQYGNPTGVREGPGGVPYSVVRDQYGNPTGVRQETGGAVTTRTSQTSSSSIRAVEGSFLVLPPYEVPADTVFDFVDRSPLSGDAETEYQL